MKRSDYDCPECDGNGELICPYCQIIETECEVCKGTGLDPKKIDVTSFRLDNENLTREYGGSWDWIEDGQWLGREAQGGAKLLLEPYLLDVEPIGR